MLFLACKKVCLIFSNVLILLTWCTHLSMCSCFSWISGFSVRLFLQFFRIAEFYSCSWVHLDFSLLDVICTVFMFSLSVTQTVDETIKWGSDPAQIFVGPPRTVLPGWQLLMITVGGFFFPSQLCAFLFSSLI